MLRTLVFIGVGSFIGGVARYLFSRFIQFHAATAFPWGTMTVNIVGCFLIGIIYGLCDRSFIMNNDLRLFLTVGLCGGFTTFSTFIHENYMFLDEKNCLNAILYSMLSLGLGLFLARLGHILVRMCLS